MSPEDAVGGEAEDPSAEPRAVEAPSVAGQEGGEGPEGLEGLEVGEPAEAEERRYPSTIGGLFYLLILATATTGIVLAYVDDWRLGVRVLGAGLVGASSLRLVLPQRDAGMLAVRHRLTDVLLLLATGLALFFLSGDIPDQPL